MAQRQKILVVDDDKISLDVNVLLLKGIDADIVTAMSGDEAIKKTIVEDFDLILTDVMMPGLDGFETIKAIRKDERNNAIPVIFITSLQGDELRIIKGLTLGAIDFITKPVRKEILNLKASNLLELQRNKRELELTARRLDQKIIEVEELNIKEQIHAKKAHEIIMQACMDGFLTIDIKGKILEANRTYANMIGYSRDELCSMSISDIEAVEESETAEKHIQKILSTGADRFDTIHKSKGGRLIPTEIGARYDSGNDQMYIFVKDITLRKLREKTQAELEKTISEKESLIAELNKSLAMIKTLGSILPICSCCKKIRDDNGYWEQVDTYIREHSDTQFSHSICPDCAKKIYPDLHLYKAD